MGFSIGKVVSHLGGSSGIGGAIGAVAGSLLGGPAGASIGQSFGSGLGSMFGPSASRLENREYQLQKRRAIELWNMENEYNSPLAQMQRLRDAGLNPALVYSGGNVTGNSSSGIDVNYSRPSSSGGQKQIFNKSIEEFFLKNQMHSAENQTEEQVLRNDGLRLRNQILALQLEKLGHPVTSNKLRSGKPLTLSEAKTIRKIVGGASQPTPLKGSSAMSAIPNFLENVSYWLTDELAGKYYKGYNDPLEYDTTGELF